MQTFLPYSDFKKTFSVLDYRRLGKQRVEAMQILNVLENKQKTNGWRNHPAVLMWRGYEDALKLYHNDCIKEWIKRGYNNTMEFKKHKKIDKIKFPWWLGNEDFHRSHRSRLIEKDENFYLEKFPGDKNFNSSKYLWPVNESRTWRII